ncbi:heptaprenyl diphosphate synthase component 1 [Bacillus alveayuensis]|uniref:Heptaprenyl diphosphate synthase n=1 Tax=Aeribacillus alveayuensis TaxID=279215 RepID=A0ABT9VKM4_9BACI|nr:heptaprenyl diphosphate synthase component 1 [Bacillus alveayuensis]MDQ0161529.1 heptaprenyl diphosphate synthase [Bacillus alveayuensis]
MKDIFNHMNGLKQKIEQNLSHPFLSKHVQKPNIDEDKLLLFYAMFKEANVSEKELEKYVVTAMLVQIALDTHDLVGIVKCHGRKEFVERQLTVLAGDYFSGLYYYILANMNDIKMIQTFAIAIKEINEHKIRLYQSKQDVKKMIENIMTIETALFQRIGEHLQVKTLPKLSQFYLTFKRLCQEKNNYEVGQSSIFQKGIDQMTKNQQESVFSIIIEFCQHYFHEIIRMLETNLKHSSTIKEFIFDRIHTLRFTYERTFNNMVEEG